MKLRQLKCTEDKFHWMWEGGLCLARDRWYRSQQQRKLNVYVDCCSTFAYAHTSARDTKKTGSLKFISPPVKIYTSRNINSMSIIQFFSIKDKLC